MIIKVQTIEGSDDLMLSEEVTIMGVTIPEKFVWDGCSTPRPLWSILPPFKKTFIASLLHDYLCRIANDAEDRKAADEAFRYALEHLCKVVPWRIKAGYRGVRVGAFFGVGIHYPHWTDKIRSLYAKYKN